MPFFLFCFFVIAVICLFLGLRKSSLGQVEGRKEHCAVCGWTKEKVQLCQFEQHHTTTVTPLCFDCSVKHEAMPVRGSSVGRTRAAYV